MSIQNTNFKFIPNELIVEMLSYVDTVDLIHFCEALDCDYLLQERGVTRTLNLFRRYELKDLKPLKTIVPEYITTLDINGLYWIRVADLRRFVDKLTNLENLFAIKTPLGLSLEDLIVYNRSNKLAKLAVTLSDPNTSPNYATVESIRCLYVDVAVEGATLRPLTLQGRIRNRFPGLLKLWLDLGEAGNGLLLRYFSVNGIALKIFYRIMAPITMIDYTYMGFKQYYNNRRACHHYELCCENSFLLKDRSDEDILGTAGSQKEVWETLERLHAPKPYGPRDARRLLQEEATLDDILYEELNFFHTPANCIAKYLDVTEQMLKSPNAKKIKKLCIMTCLLQYREVTEVLEETSNGFKKRRVGFDNGNGLHPTQELFNNFPDLELLEIFDCNQTNLSFAGAVFALPQISAFKNLKILLIDIPVPVDGSFLINVIKSCKLLQVLKIKAMKQNEKLNFYVHKAITEANSLRDFRFKNHRIQIDKLLKSLSEIKSRNLQRLLLICTQVATKFSAAPLKTFLEQNPQLMFLHIVISDGTEAFKKAVQNTLNEYQKLHPAKKFIVAKSEYLNKRGLPIPDIHFMEMVKTDSTVATLDPFQDFKTF